MSAGISPLGEWMRPYRPPRDALTQEVSRLLTTPSDVHKMFTENVYTPGMDVDDNNRVSELIRAMPVCLQADVALTACKKEKRDPTESEAALIAQADAMRDKLVQVDVHESLGPLEVPGYERPAILGTTARQAKGAASFEQATSAAAAASA